MREKELKVINSLKKIFFWSLLSGIFFLLSGCGDFVKETDAEACNKAIDGRDYDTALSACTSRKDKAAAWMGKAGYDIVNLLKSSSSAPSAYNAPSNVQLGTDDISGASILNILQLSTSVISDDTERATAINNSKNYLDNASALLHPAVMDNGTSVSADEILLNTFALAFSMQLYQVITYDNATTASSIVPNADNISNLTCPEVSGADGTEAQSMLKAMDGHLWTTERNAVQCQLMKTAIESLSAQDIQDVTDNLSSWTEGSQLPEEISDLVCNPVNKLVEYLAKLTNSVNKLNLSGDNTKAITDAQTSTNTLLTKIGCNE